jgi:hypothetical protein
MVDQVGTFEEALITARNLAKTYKNKTKK